MTPEQAELSAGFNHEILYNREGALEAMFLQMRVPLAICAYAEMVLRRLAEQQNIPVLTAARTRELTIRRLLDKHPDNEPLVKFLWDLTDDQNGGDTTPDAPRRQ